MSNNHSALKQPFGDHNVTAMALDASATQTIVYLGTASGFAGVPGLFKATVLR